MEWIAVSERLPKAIGDYLVFHYVDSLPEIAWAFFNGNKNFVGAPNKTFTGVTHWMPLPEPPKDK